jgi:hypothetical protein
MKLPGHTYGVFVPSISERGTTFSINHDYLPHKLSINFLCFYNIQGVALVPLESEPPPKY